MTYDQHIKQQLFYLTGNQTWDENTVIIEKNIHMFGKPEKAWFYDGYTIDTYHVIKKEGITICQKYLSAGL